MEGTNLKMTLAASVLLLVLASVTGLEGPNVCTRQESYTTTTRETVQKPTMVKEYTWCYNIPPRCSKYRLNYRTEIKIHTIEKTRPVEECCKGYTLTTDGNACIPVCKEACVHGVCDAPDRCKCESGWRGPKCDVYCPPGYQQVVCLNNSKK